MNQQIRFCTTPDGVQLAYAVSGEGSALVMSATWLTHLEHQWQSLAWRPWLDAFTSEHKVLRHDSRGCGLSDRSTKDLSFETWVRDLECVVEAAAFRRFSMVGTCWGGPIAIEYAARHPASEQAAGSSTGADTGHLSLVLVAAPRPRRDTGLNTTAFICLTVLTGRAFRALARKPK